MGPALFQKLVHKRERLKRLRSVVGLTRALDFELMWMIRRPEIEIAVPGFNRRFVIRRFSSDIHVFDEVFCQGELDAYLPDDPRFIIDGGANVGYTTAFLAGRFPGATVIAVEPSPANVVQFRRNCAGYKNIVLLEGALWPVSSDVRIVNPEADSWSYRVAAGSGPGSVRAYTIDDIITQFAIDHIDFIKLDIEGAERQIFESNFEHWLPRVKALLVEIHGEQARSAIDRACSHEEFAETARGEKRLLVRRARESMRRVSAGGVDR
jgi:FkbM family methyltransferase